MGRYISNVPILMQRQQYKRLLLLPQCFFPMLTITHRHSGVLSELPTKALNPRPHSKTGQFQQLRGNLTNSGSLPRYFSI